MFVFQLQKELSFTDKSVITTKDPNVKKYLTFIIYALCITHDPADHASHYHTTKPLARELKSHRLHHCTGI
jgi:hypothetical protein